MMRKDHRRGLIVVAILVPEVIVAATMDTNHLGMISAREIFKNRSVMISTGLTHVVEVHFDAVVGDSEDSAKEIDVLLEAKKTKVIFLSVRLWFNDVRLSLFFVVIQLCHLI